MLTKQFSYSVYAVVMVFQFRLPVLCCSFDNFIDCQQSSTICYRYLHGFLYQFVYNYNHSTVQPKAEDKVFMLHLCSLTHRWYGFSFSLTYEDQIAEFNGVYDQPWIRIAPFLLGMCLGYILFKTNETIRLNIFVVVAGMIVIKKHPRQRS